MHPQPNTFKRLTDRQRINYTGFSGYIGVNKYKLFNQNVTIYFFIKLSVSFQIIV